MAGSEAGPGPRRCDPARVVLLLAPVVLFAVGVAAALILGCRPGLVAGIVMLAGGVAQIPHAARFGKWGEILIETIRGVIYLGAGGALVLDLLPTPHALAVVLVVLVVAFRTLRKQTTLYFLRMGLELARCSSARGIRRLVSVTHVGFRSFAPLRARLAGNMRRAGVYRPGLVDLHLLRAADQMELMMQILRAGYPDSGVRERFAFDDSLRYLRQAHDAGRGVLIISPHLCCYPLAPRVFADHVPCSIYLRRSPSASKHAMNLAIGEAGGGHLVHPPDDGSDAEKLTVAMRVLRERRGLYITPDVPRKSDEGVPVRIFGRTTYFPTGVIIMAMRTKAPVVLAMWHHAEGLYHVRFDEPKDFSARGDRGRRAAAAMQAFAASVDGFLHEYPEMWWNWLDKRWTRILRDSRGEGS